MTQGSPMRIVHAARFALGLSLVAPLAAGATSGAPGTRAHHWACAPCGGPCDGKTYEHPGHCPLCGMPLVEEGIMAR
jgi:Cu2+-exporting ATPase